VDAKDAKAAEAANAHGHVFDAARRIARQNAQRRADDALFMRMYGSRDVTGSGVKPDKGGPRSASKLQDLSFNLVRSVVNTAAAHISSKRPKPKFQTDDADWGLVQRAQACEQAVKGIFQANDFYGLAQQAFLDAAIASLGGVFVFSESGRVKIERSFPGEVLVDKREGYYGKPRTLYRVRLVDPQVLQETFELDEPPQTTLEMGAEMLRMFDWLEHDNVTDQTVTVEAWRLPYRNAAGELVGGKHIIACPGRTLVYEDFARERFPFVPYRWDKRQFGFYGCGIVENLRGHQRALNYLHLKIADMVHKNSRSNLVVFDTAKGQSGVNVQHVDNDPSTILRVRTGGQPPIVLKQNAVPEELFAYRREIIEDGYAQEGLSQLGATGQVPRGVESGVAMRELEDAGSRRWSTKTQGHERFALDVARVIIDELKEMAERDELEPVRVTIRKGSRAKVELIDWRKVALDDNQYTLDLTPASSLPDSTAGRTQTVTDWLGAGLITQQEAKALLDHPDLERFKSLDLSSYEVILDTIERIVEDGEYFPPEPTDDLELAVKLVTQSYNKFRLRKVPDARLELLRQYLDDVRYLLEQAANEQAQAQAQGATQAAPPGAVDPAAAAQAIPGDAGAQAAIPAAA
jgi:hypothetical protein